MTIFLFGEKYVVNENEIKKYFYFFNTKVIQISDIKMVEIVTVNRIGTINLYIGKKANAVKEDGYYLVMNDNSVNKIISGYENKKGIDLGNFIIENYKVRYKKVKKYKLLNDNL